MKQTELSPEIVEQIKQAVRSIRYGTVQVTMHNARVVQIDKVEKIRIKATTADPSQTNSVMPTDRTSEGIRQQQGR